MEWQDAAEQLVESVASSSPTPGGGAVAAHTGALGCALGLMAIRTTLKNKQISIEQKTRLEQSAKRLEGEKNELKKCTVQDAKAYESFLAAKHLPKEDPSRTQAMQEALCYAAEVPVQSATYAQKALKDLTHIQDDIAPIILSDNLCGIHLLKTSIRMSVENIRANLPFIKQADKKQALEKQIGIFLDSCK